MSAPQKKPNNSGWYSWPIIIVLFALGIWPVALILLFVNIFGEGKRRTTPSSQRKPSAEERMEAAVEDAVDRALAKAREAGNRATASRRKSAAQESLDRAMAAAQSDMDRAVADVERAAEDLAKEFAADERKAAAPKKAAKKKKKKKEEPENLPGKLLRVIGLCLLWSVWTPPRRSCRDGHFIWRISLPGWALPPPAASCGAGASTWPAWPGGPTATPTPSARRRPCPWMRSPSG